MLADRLDQDTCVFADVAAFFTPQVKEVVAELYKKPSFAVEVLAPLICNRQAVSRRAWCVRHKQNCYYKTAHKHTAGSSCTAHSKQGKQRSLADKNVIHLLAWIAMRLEVQEAEIDLENVESFPTSMLDRFLGALYYIEAQVLDPRLFGFLFLSAQVFLLWTCLHYTESQIQLVAKTMLGNSHKIQNMSI